MQLPKLTPLQSRFAASLAATFICLLIFYCLNQPSFAYASDLDSRPSSENNQPILDQSFVEEKEDDGALPVKRQQDAPTMVLSNNSPMAQSLSPGSIQFWTFSQASIDGPAGIPGFQLPSSTGANLTVTDGEESDDEGDLVKRQSSATVWITITTCQQPSYAGDSPEADEAIPPQLTVYTTQSDDNKTPGPDSTDAGQQTTELDGGYALVRLTGDSTVYISVSAPNTTSFTGQWNYQVAASVDAPFHASMSQTPNLHFVDADTRAALLITDDLTSAESNETSFQEWMELDPPPYGMIVFPASSRSVQGVQNSYCGLRMEPDALFTNLEGSDNQNIAGMTSRGLGGKPKEQFYVTGLNLSTEYTGFLARQPNRTAAVASSIGGGGTVWRAVQFNTKSMDNCALMYNLTFCSEVAYAVPTNPERFSTREGLPELSRIYDDYAREMYRFFNFSLQQIPCNASSTSAYSLVRNCDDCARAYKTWLCAVTIPRCEDYTNPATWLKPRNVGQAFPNGSSISTTPGFGDAQQVLMEQVATNSSRSAVIDDDISPGPYKEVLPCKDLCWDLVQSCPAALGFSCPIEGKGLEDSYGERSDNAGNISCSYLGAAYFLSNSNSNAVQWALVLGISVSSTIFVLL